MNATQQRLYGSKEIATRFSRNYAGETLAVS